MIDILQFPFMQRAFIAGIILGVVLAYLGIFVVLRKMSFYSDGIAHASLAGVAIGVLASINPLLTAILLSVVLSVAIFYLEKKTKLSSDAIIGIIFTFGMALGVLLMSFKARYQPELISFLFGNILAIKTSELIIISVLSIIILGYLIIKQKKLLLLSFDKELAYVSGVKVNLNEILLNIFLAISVVLGIKILGVILVSALLIIPVASAKLISNSFKTLKTTTLIISEITIFLGLIISYYLNLPTGAVIVLCGSAIFFAILIYSSLKKSIIIK